jgi:DNA-binding protein H-NS
VSTAEVSRGFPKYQNPAEPSETWSGLGKWPGWPVSALKADGMIEDFKIAVTAPDEIKAQH